MRICVIGNSHVACLKEAWTELAPDCPGVEVRFFASPARGLDSLALIDGELAASDPNVTKHMQITSGGFGAIELAEYDVFLVHALHLVMAPLWSSLSRAVIVQSLADMSAKSTNVRLCRAIRQASDRAVYSGHTPMSARAAPLKNHVSYADMASELRSILAGVGVTLLNQPSETVLQPFGTQEQFARGSKKLEFASPDRRFHDEGEVHHMNVDFGRLLFADFLNALGVFPKGVERCTAS